MVGCGWRDLKYGADLFGEQGDGKQLAGLLQRVGDGGQVAFGQQAVDGVDTAAE